MYKPIYDCAVKNRVAVNKHMTCHPISGYIHLDENGNYLFFNKLDKPVKKLCPRNMIGGNFGAAPVCDKLNKVLVMNTTVEKTHRNFMTAMSGAAEVSERALAAYLFLMSYEEDDELRNKVLDDIEASKIKPDAYISFFVDDTELEDDDSWKQWYFDSIDVADKDKNKKEISIISGSLVSYGDGKYPMIKDGPVGSGIPVFSNSSRQASGKDCSFLSYGLYKPYDACTMSEEEAELIKAGLEHLFTSGHNCNRTFNLLYWYDDDVRDVLGSITNSGDEYQAFEVESEWKKVFDSVIEKTDYIDDINPMMHIIRYDIPAQGRFSLGEESLVPYQDLCRNLKQWYEDSELLVDFYDKKKEEFRTIRCDISNIYAVLLNTMNNIASNDGNKVKKEYGREFDNLLNAVLFNKQIPKRIFRNAIFQGIRSVIGGEAYKGEKRSKRVIIQTIKVFLNRTGKERFGMGLDTESRNAGYLCGRILAIMDSIQYAAFSGKVGKTVSSKMIRVVMKNPNTGMIMTLQNADIYLKKLEAVNPGKAMFYRRLLDETLSLFGDILPQKLTMEEQGALLLGFRQQELVNRSNNNQKQEGDQDHE